MLDLPTNTFTAYKLQGSLLAIMDLEKCYMKNSVKLKNQLKIYFKQAFNLFLDLRQALTTNASYCSKLIYKYVEILSTHLKPMEERHQHKKTNLYD